jgi:transmembrane sensor
VFSFKKEYMSDDDYIKILTGTATAEEKKSFYGRLDSDPALRDEYAGLLKLWDLSGISSLKVPENRKREMFSRFWSATRKKERSRVMKLMTPLIRYAAIILIALLAGYLIRYVTSRPAEIPFYAEFHSSAGSISSATLSDGSYIWLNANTRLSVELTQNNVLAKLEGEAYFNVPHNPEREFIIDIGRIRVHDLGTEFNISSYTDRDVCKVTLLDGDLDITDIAGNVIRNLDVGETFNFSRKASTYSVEKIDPGLVTGWMEGKFVFIDRTLAEICEELEKWYGITIVIEKESMRDVRYTSVMKRTTTVKSVLEMLKVTTKIKYTIEEKKEGKDIIRLQ